MEPLKSPLGWVKPFRCGPTLCYLVAGELLIDAHERISGANLRPKSIFLTHEHWDHCAGIDNFKCDILICSCSHARNNRIWFQRQPFLLEQLHNYNG